MISIWLELTPVVWIANKIIQIANLCKEISNQKSKIYSLWWGFSFIAEINDFNLWGVLSYRYYYIFSNSFFLMFQAAAGLDLKDNLASGAVWPYPSPYHPYDAAFAGYPFNG